MRLPTQPPHQCCLWITYMFIIIISCQSRELLLGCSFLFSRYSPLGDRSQSNALVIPFLFLYLSLFSPSFLPSFTPVYVLPSFLHPCSLLPFPSPPFVLSFRPCFTPVCSPLPFPSPLFGLSFLPSFTPICSLLPSFLHPYLFSLPSFIPSFITDFVVTAVLLSLIFILSILPSSIPSLTPTLLLFLPSPIHSFIINSTSHMLLLPPPVSLDFDSSYTGDLPYFSYTFLCLLLRILHPAGRVQTFSDKVEKKK